MSHKLVETKDGSMTYHNAEYGETYHSTSGAIEESQKKFVEPCEIRDGMRILDIGFGLGYNILMAIHTATKLEIISLEKDEDLLRSLTSIRVPKALEDDYTKVQKAAELKHYGDADCSITVILGDATRTVHDIEGSFDAVFLDAFSPKKNPELWTKEFFDTLFALMKPGARLATYSCAGAVRRNLVASGFEVIDGPRVGRRSPSTIAIKPDSGQTL